MRTAGLLSRSSAEPQQGRRQQQQQRRSFSGAGLVNTPASSRLLPPPLSRSNTSGGLTTSPLSATAAAAGRGGQQQQQQLLPRYTTHGLSASPNTGPLIRMPGAALLYTSQSASAAGVGAVVVPRARESHPIAMKHGSAAAAAAGSSLPLATTTTTKPTITTSISASLSPSLSPTLFPSSPHTGWSGGTMRHGASGGVNGSPVPPTTTTTTTTTTSNTTATVVTNVPATNKAHNSGSFSPLAAESALIPTTNSPKPTGMVLRGGPGEGSSARHHQHSSPHDQGDCPSLPTTTVGTTPAPPASSSCGNPTALGGGGCVGGNTELVLSMNSLSITPLSRGEVDGGEERGVTGTSSSSPSSSSARRPQTTNTTNNPHHNHISKGQRTINGRLVQGTGASSSSPRPSNNSSQNNANMSPHPPHTSSGGVTPSSRSQPLQQQQRVGRLNGIGTGSSTNTGSRTALVGGEDGLGGRRPATSAAAAIAGGEGGTVLFAGRYSPRRSLDLSSSGPAGLSGGDPGLTIITIPNPNHPAAAAAADYYEPRYAALLLEEREEHRKELDRLWLRMRRAEETAVEERERRREVQQQLWLAQRDVLLREEERDRLAIAGEDLADWLWLMDLLTRVCPAPDDLTRGKRTSQSQGGSRAGRLSRASPRADPPVGRLGGGSGSGAAPGSRRAKTQSGITRDLQPQHSHDSNHHHHHHNADTMPVVPPPDSRSPSNSSVSMSALRVGGGGKAGPVCTAVTLHQPNPPSSHTYVRDSDLLRALQRAEQRIVVLEREARRRAEREEAAAAATTTRTAAPPPPTNPAAAAADVMVIPDDDEGDEGDDENYGTLLPSVPSAHSFDDYLPPTASSSGTTTTLTTTTATRATTGYQQQQQRRQPPPTTTTTSQSSAAMMVGRLNGVAFSSPIPFRPRTTPPAAGAAGRAATANTNRNANYPHSGRGPVGPGLMAPPQNDTDVPGTGTGSVKAEYRDGGERRRRRVEEDGNLKQEIPHTLRVNSSSTSGSSSHSTPTTANKTNMNPRTTTRGAENHSNSNSNSNSNSGGDDGRRYNEALVRNNEDERDYRPITPALSIL